MPPSRASIMSQRTKNVIPRLIRAKLFNKWGTCTIASCFPSRLQNRFGRALCRAGTWIVHHGGTEAQRRAGATECGVSRINAPSPLLHSVDQHSADHRWIGALSCPCFCDGCNSTTRISQGLTERAPPARNDAGAGALPTSVPQCRCGEPPIPPGPALRRVSVVG
jgi:hypothetical protein